MAPIERPDWSGSCAVVPADDNDVPVTRGLDPDLTDALRDPTVARRYQGVVERGFDGARLSMDEARADLPAALAAEWDNSKAPDGLRLRNAQDAAIAAIDRLAPEDRDELVSGFDGLPESARAAILGELSLGGAARGRAVSDAELALIMDTPAGKILRGEWHNQTAVKNVGIVVSRFERIVNRMTEGERDAALDWFDGLPPTVQAGICRALVAR